MNFFRKLLPKFIWRKSSLTLNQLNGSFSMNPPPSSGWYMLEIEVLSHLQLVQLSIFIIYDDGSTDELWLPAKSAVLSKRLLNVYKRALSVIIRFKSEEMQGDVVRFALKRVSKGFAESRLLKKLGEVHPVFRLVPKQMLLNRQYHQQSNAELWAEYNKLFDSSVDLNYYEDWLQKYTHTSGLITSKQGIENSLKKGNDAIENGPLISIVMSVFNSNHEWLKLAIDSVFCQSYTNWQLCLVDDASSDPEIKSILLAYERQDCRVDVRLRDNNGHISLASNDGLSMCKGDFVAFLDHDDVLSPTALQEVVQVILNSASSTSEAVDVIYTDQDSIDENGKRHMPFFKGNWNKYLFYSHNYVNHLTVIRLDLVKAVDGFTFGMEGAQDYDLLLKIMRLKASLSVKHIPKVLYHWRGHSQSTASDISAKPYALTAGKRALEEHFKSLGELVSIAHNGASYKVQFSLPSSPSVCIVIPTRDGLYLKKSIESILDMTVYPNFNVIVVDNGSVKKNTLDFLNLLVKRYSKVHVVRIDEPFNFSLLNNRAVSLSSGEIIGMVNDDIEVVDPNWLNEIVSLANRPDVGVVGAKLLYPDGSIQHAGLVLGIHQSAGHVHRYLHGDDIGYFGRAGNLQETSAVTGACMFVKRSIYDEVGGLDEKLAVTCNDIDFCIKVREAGYVNLYTPYTKLVHHESVTRGFDDVNYEKQQRSESEKRYLLGKWGDLLLMDPYYNPNLTLQAESFQISWPPRINYD